MKKFKSNTIYIYIYIYICWNLKVMWRIESIDNDKLQQFDDNVEGLLCCDGIIKCIEKKIYRNR